MCNLARYLTREEVEIYSPVQSTPRTKQSGDRLQMKGDSSNKYKETAKYIHRVKYAREEMDGGRCQTLINEER